MSILSELLCIIDPDPIGSLSWYPDTKDLTKVVSHRKI